VRLTRRSSLADVAAEVARALAAAGIKAVLTGGACATLYTKGEYQSSDLDFILQSSASQRQLDAAMEAVGFRRAADRYEHPEARFFVEFPAGPLSIGADIAIQPVEYAIGNVKIKLLSPTDACRDRLAAFYHWRDRQSLETAALIARHNKVDLDVIREWSSREDASADFKEFLRVVGNRRRLRSGAGAGRSRKKAKPG
jgi:hypothetical protein